MNIFLIRLYRFLFVLFIKVWKNFMGILLIFGVLLVGRFLIVLIFLYSVGVLRRIFFCFVVEIVFFDLVIIFYDVIF